MMRTVRCSKYRERGMQEAGGFSELLTRDLGENARWCMAFR
jgi:hypothetical protein